ncbi:MAG TPA: CHAT domain-containing protein [Bryobacteraceae bacterium]|nr:CHAT domain-containing protein [Bryobacteraceae bacterium]
MAGADEGGWSLDLLVERLANEPQPRLRRHLLLEHRQWWRPETVTRFYDEVVRRIHVDIQQADRLARSAAWLAGRLDDPASRAEGLRAQGHLLYLRRKYEAARSHYQQAASIYQSLGRTLEFGRTLSGSLQTLIYLGRYDEAMESACRAREIFSHRGERLHLARLDTNLGNLLFRQDRFEEALDHYDRARAALEELGNPLDVAIALKNIATCQISLNAFRQALDTYDQARAYCAANQMPLLAAEADYNIAYLFYLRGEYTRAIDLYRSAREHCQALGDLYHQALCDLDQSEMYLELNLSEESAWLARRSLDTFRHLGMTYELAKAITNLAIASSRHGDLERALDLFGKARELFVREKNLAWTAMIDLYLALVLFQHRRLDAAESLCEKALGFFAPSPLGGKAALCQLLLARIHLDAGRAAEARKVCLSALERLEQAETPALTWQAFFVLGAIEETLGSPDAAYEAYASAHRNMENLRSHLKAEEMKIAFLEDKLALYESLVRMCLGSGSPGARQEEAFVFMEQAKSRGLADLIAFRAQGIPPPTPAHDQLVEEMKGLREELNWYTRAIQLQENTSANLRGPRIEKLRRSARNCERRLSEVLTRLRALDQDYANLQEGAAINLDAIRSAIPADAVLVQYYRAGDLFYASLLTRKSLRTIPLGRASDLRRELQLLRFQLSKFRLGADFVRTFHHQLLRATNAHLYEFYRQLIAPIRKHLQAAHLIVAPHGFLHYVPFHALFDGEHYVSDSFSISYAPSASVYYLCSVKAPRSSEGALILGVPDPIAPHIVSEVQAVASVLPGAEVHIGPDATYERLRDAGSRKRFVHIATHGSFRQDNPMFSSISLGNAQLNLFDLYQLELPAELVTLSGCGTGLNVVVGGDELMGLKRGLLYAGAQAALLTLWDVNDQSTAEFMKLFYERLRTNSNKAEAVRSAMQELRQSCPHPFFWAPFILVGKYQ